MKIKKYLTVGLSMLLITAMVGCSSNNNKDEESKNSTTSQNVSSEKKSSENEKSEDVTYFGKVKSIVGNEVEIELAKEPDLNANGSKLPEGVEFSDSIGGDLDDIDKENTFSLGSMKDSNVENYKDSIQMDPGEGAISLGDMVDNDKLELEYTGETIKLTIPTGANIFDTRSGSDSKLSAIKINSVIKVSAQGTKELPIVKGVEIVE